MRGRRRSDDHAHRERWLVSYADFMTLLFALFVVLFASSHHDKRSIQGVSTAVRDGFQEMGAFSGDSGSLNVSQGHAAVVDSERNPSRDEGGRPSVQSEASGIDVVD